MTKELDTTMQLQVLPVFLESSTSSRTAPHYSLMVDCLATNLPKRPFEGSPFLPFTSVTFVQSLAQGSVPDIVLADLGARVLL